MSKEETNEINSTSNTPFPEWEPPPPLDDPFGPPILTPDARSTIRMRFNSS